MKEKIVLGMATALCGGALLAVTPLACWDGDFNVAVKNGVTLDVHDNVLADDGAQVTLTATTTNGVTFTWGGTNQEYTVVFQCSGLSLPTSGYGSLITMRVNNVGGNCDNRPGILLDAAGMAYGVWQDAAWSTDTISGGPVEENSGSRCFAFRYAPSRAASDPMRGTTFFEKTSGGEWRQVYAASGLFGGVDQPQACAIGGFNGYSSLYKSFDGMRLEAVAVFTPALTETELAAYRFPNAPYEFVPLASWDGDFSQLTQNGVTLNPNGNMVAADNRSLTISDTAQTGLLFGLPSGVSGSTMLVKCSNLTLPSDGFATFASVRVPPIENRVAGILDGAGVMSGVWNGAPWSTDTIFGALSTQGGQRCFAFRYLPISVLPNGTYDPARGVRVYELVSGQWGEVYHSEALMAGGDWNTGTEALSLGGPTAAAEGLGNLAGLRVDAVAIYGCALEPRDLGRIFFPSDIHTNRAAAVSGDWSAQEWEQAWVNSPRSEVTLVAEGAEDVAIALDSDVQMGTLKVTGAGNVELGATTHDVQFGVVDASAATGTVEIGCPFGWAAVKAGADTRIAEAGWGPLQVPSSATVRLSASWHGAVSGEGLIVLAGTGDVVLSDLADFTGTLRVEGGTAVLTNATLNCGALELAGGTLLLRVGQAESVDVAAGATLKLHFMDGSYVNGYTAEGVRLAAGQNVVFVLPDGSEVMGEGTTLPRPSNVWTSNGTGSWNDASRWSLGHVPTYGENIEFRPGTSAEVTLPGETVQLGNVNVEGPVRLTNGRILTVKLTVARDCFLEDGEVGQIALASGATVEIAPAAEVRMEVPNGIFGEGTLVKSGAGALVVGTNAENCVLMANAVNVNAGALTLKRGRVEGAFTLAEGVALDAEGTLVSSNAVSFAAVADMTVFTNNAARLSAAGPLTVDGAASLTFGCMTACGDVFTVGESGVVLTRACTFDGPLVGEGPITATGGNIVFSGTKEDYSGHLIVGADAIVTTTDGAFGRAVVEGDGVLRAQGVLPNADLCDLLQSALTWKGTCWLYAIAGTCVDINPAKYGNRKSRVRLTGVTGYLPKSGLCELPVELVDDGGMKAFTLNNGYSDNTMSFTFAKVSGTGTLQDAHGSRQIINILDGSELTGDINLNAELAGKRIVFGTMTTPPTASASITVEAGHTNRIGTANTWRAKGGIYIYGVVKASTAGNFCAAAFNTSVAEEGEIVYDLRGDYMDDYTNTAVRITGTGTIHYTGDSRYLQNTAALRYATTLHVRNDLEKYLVLTEYGTAAAPTLTTIGSLSGTGDLCTAFYGGENSRSLKVVQRRDTEWSGSIDGKTSSNIYDRFHTLYVDGAEDAEHRTLTLSGDNSRCSNMLNVCSNGSARLTGTWRGDVTVAGAFGGSGTILEGSLALQDGAVIDLRAGVVTAPSLTLPAEGTLFFLVDEMPQRTVKVVDLPARAAGRLPRAVLRVADAQSGGVVLSFHEDGLYLSPAPTILLMR